MSNDQLKKGVDVPLEPGELITGTRLMEITGCTKQEFMIWCGKGTIQSVKKTRKGWALFDETAVRAVQSEQKKTGARVLDLAPADVSFTREQAVKVLTLLREGKEPVDIMLEADIHPRMFRGIMKEYEALKFSMILYKHEIDEINSLKLEGNFPIKTSGDLIEVLRIAAEERACSACKKRTKSQMCSTCERKRVLKNIVTKTSTNGASKPDPPVDDSQPHDG